MDKLRRIGDLLGLLKSRPGMKHFNIYRPVTKSWRTIIEPGTLTKGFAGDFLLGSNIDS